MDSTHPAPSTAMKRQHALRGALTVEDVMTRTPYTVDSHEPLSAAQRKMSENGIRHLPVLTSGKLVGVLSQRDLYFLDALGGMGATFDVVSDAMTSEIFTVGPKAKLRDVVHEMNAHRYGCAVVVDGGNVVGIFTASDALELLTDALS